jgi:toxin ParE1/3/4
MRIVIRERAADDLDNIYSWIAKDSPRAATEIVARISKRINLLATPGFAYMGRPGLVRGTRELVEPPYVVVYEVHEDLNELPYLPFHSAQGR